ncbi:MAG: hypothetical protein ABIQ31_19385 [Ferruginibacter sp.]
MKKLFLALLFTTLIPSLIFAQETRELEKVIELKMPGGNGRNGACVAYHPLQKKYYAGFAGNALYPMAVFDTMGKRISKDDLHVGFDLRGIWYNTMTGTLQANGYQDFGWTDLTLNKMGIPIANKIFLKETSQPTEQSVGCWDDKNGLIYFLSDNKIVACYLNGSQKNEVKLIVSEDSATEENDAYLPEKYNSTALIFTGIANAEWGLLDVENKQVVLFDSAGGKAGQIWNIDSENEFPSSFGFSYANGIVFIFNKEDRVWTGYK